MAHHHERDRSAAPLPEAPSFDYEREAGAQGYRLIAGVDEVGRGAIAGPVAAGAVILPPGIKARWLKDVRDSKQLTIEEREALFPLIQQAAVASAVGMVSQEDIDREGIVPATRLAMRLALEGLAVQPDFVLIDFMALPEVPLRQTSIVHGDNISLSIACASIVAKVTRDRHMKELHRLYPQYGFNSHKGYATDEHLTCLERHGPCPLHRRTFRPLAQERLL